MTQTKHPPEFPGRFNTVFFKKLGARVATLRKEANITQTQLAETLRISQQLIAAYEAGTRKIPASLLPDPGAVVRGVSGGADRYGEATHQTWTSLDLATADGTDRLDAQSQTEVYYRDAGGVDQTTAIGIRIITRQLKQQAPR